MSTRGEGRGQGPAKKPRRSRRLTTSQRSLLIDLEMHGATIPHYAEKARAMGLAKRGLVVWEGQHIQITRLGREALSMADEAERGGAR